MNRRPLRACRVGFAVLALAARSPATPGAEPERIVFLGDSITDGFTYPLLIQQALRDAGQSVPVCIGAGVGGDTAQQMRRRLECDVLRHRPTRVTLSVGVNDVLRKVPLAEFEADVRAIAEQLGERKIPLIILTTSVLGPKHAEADRQLDDFNAILRRVAKEHGLTIAEVNQQMRAARDGAPRDGAARDGGDDLLEADQIHLSFAGYRALTRAVLDALGYADVPVPKEQKLDLMPGIIRRWQIRPAPDDKPLDEAAAKQIASLADGWTEYALPEAKPKDHWWPEQERGGVLPSR